MAIRMLLEPYGPYGVAASYREAVRVRCRTIDVRVRLPYMGYGAGGQNRTIGEHQLVRG